MKRECCSESYLMSGIVC